MRHSIINLINDVSCKYTSDVQFYLGHEDKIPAQQKNPALLIGNKVANTVSTVLRNLEENI